MRSSMQNVFRQWKRLRFSSEPSQASAAKAATSRQLGTRTAVWGFGLCGLLMGCGDQFQLQVQLPDGADADEVTLFVLTALDPREMEPGLAPMECGQLGVFAPESPYARDASDVQGATEVYINRGEASRDNVFDVPWDYFDNAVLSLIHVEAMGTVRFAQDPSATPGADDWPLFEGCGCFRLSDNVDDATVPEGCATKLERGTNAEIMVHPIAEAPFFLRSCAAKNGPVVGGTIGYLHPGICVDVKRCEGVGETDCYTCQSPVCSELDDLSGVPIELEVTGGVGPEIITTGSDGVIEPEIRLDECPRSREVVVTASIVGRPDTQIEIRTPCIESDSLLFDSQRGTFPPEIGPSKLAVAPQGQVVVATEFAPGLTRISTYELESATLVRRDQLDVIGAVQDMVGFSRSTVDDSFVVALATTSSTGVNLGLFEIMPRIRQVSSFTGDCVARCPTGDCHLSEGTHGMSMVAHDADGDGITDLSVASSGDTQVSSFVSGGSPLELANTCQCREVYGNPRAMAFVALDGGPADDMFLGSEPRNGNFPHSFFSGQTVLFSTTDWADDRQFCGVPTFLSPGAADEMVAGDLGGGTDLLIHGHRWQSDLALYSGPELRMLASGDELYPDPQLVGPSSLGLGLTITDFNGDLWNDAVLVDPAIPALNVYFGAQNGALADPVQYPLGCLPSGIQSVAFGDLDGDQRKEAVLHCFASSGQLMLNWYDL